MSVRAKYHLLIFVVWFGGGFILLLLGHFVYPAITLLLLPYALLVSFLTVRMRCPNCKRRVMWQGYLLFSYLRKFCSCGYDLRAKQGERRG